MTERLDYFDPYQRQFDARVVAIEEWRGAPAVILDRTCFYPTSGGQLHDTGQLGGVAVSNVIIEAGALLHLMAAPPPFVPGDNVTGFIDWERRYDHMQQHSGQHLLSQLIFQRFGFETVSVHFGSMESTLDLDTAALPASFLQDIELTANQLAYNALDIRAYLVDDAEAKLLPLRRPPAVTGVIRIVEIDGFDYSACGGTHVSTTAEIAPIQLLRHERRRNLTRLTFLCGLRAYRNYAEKARVLSETAALFSTDATGVPELVQKQQIRLRELEKKNAELQSQVLTHLVAELHAYAPRINDIAVVEHLSTSASLEELKQMAALLCARPKTLGLLVSSANDKVNVIFCRSDDLSVHVGNLLRDALAGFGGRGGGRPEYAQGGGVPVAMAADLLAYARQHFTQST